MVAHGCILDMKVRLQTLVIIKQQNGSQPVVVTRSADSEEINVVLNRCRHRGASVCQDECGNAHVLRCAYHGWTYSNSGKLLGAPFQDGYGEEFNREEMGLIRVPKVDSYRGFIFKPKREGLQTFDRTFRKCHPYIDYVAESGPEGIELSAGKHKYFLNANWKFQVENTIDPYHLSFVHKTFFDIVAERTGEKMKFAKMHKEEKGIRSRKWSFVIRIGRGFKYWGFTF